MSKVFKTNFRIYWEDTDGGGVVYYANYLKFAERARTEMLRDAGIIQSELLKSEEVCFVVRHFECDLKKPARLDDSITVETKITKFAGASITMHQKILNGEDELADLKILIACVNLSFKPAKIPSAVREKLS